MNPDNQGYCPPKTPGPECPPYGTFDLSSCRKSGNIRPPVYSSQPYFFGADPALREGVDGLYIPTKDNASTKVYVEPVKKFVNRYFASTLTMIGLQLRDAPVVQLRKVYRLEDQLSFQLFEALWKTLVHSGQMLIRMVWPLWMHLRGQMRKVSFDDISQNSSCPFLFCNASS